MKKKYFLNANIIDPHNSLEEVGGLIVGESGKIEAVGKKVNKNNIPSRENFIDLKENYIFTIKPIKIEQKKYFKMMPIKFGIWTPCAHLIMHCSLLQVCVMDGFLVFNITVKRSKHGAELFMLKRGRSKPLKQFIIKIRNK